MLGVASPATAVATNIPSAAGNMDYLLQGGLTIHSLNTEGCFIESLFLAFAASAPVSSLATVFRLFVCPANALLTGILLIDEISLPAVTIGALQPSVGYNIPIQKAIPAGYGLGCNVTTTETAPKGWKAVVSGGFF